MPNKAPNFAEKTFVDSGREVAKGKLTSKKLEAIVSQLSDEERPKFQQLFSALAEDLQPEPVTDPPTDQKPLELSAELTAQIEQAKEILGEDFMGPEQYEKAFGFLPTLEQIPEIPFSRERLERAKQMGQMLVLHVDTAPDGKLMTMQNTNTMQAESDRNGRVLYDTDWYQNEGFHTQEIPRASWRLVSKGIVPDSAGKNEVQQLELIVQALQNEVFKGMEVPTHYQEAIDEFEAQKAKITEYMKSDKKWPKASEMIEALALSKLTRGTPAEMLQAIEIHHQNTDKYLFGDVYVRTPRRASYGGLVRVGLSFAHGVDVGSDWPGNRLSGVGVSLSLQS